MYPTHDAALASADLVMPAGLDEDPAAVAMFATGRYADVLQRYERTHPESHLRRVQAAFHILIALAPSSTPPQSSTI